MRTAITGYIIHGNWSLPDVFVRRHIALSVAHCTLKECYIQPPANGINVHKMEISEPFTISKS